LKKEKKKEGIHSLCQPKEKVTLRKPMVGSWIKPIPNEKRVFPKCFMQKN
jgi:hypothetical protein